MVLNNGFITPLRCGESKLIKGHIEPSSSVVAITLDQQTYGDAVPNHIYYGDTAWVKGVKLVGSLGVNEVKVEAVGLEPDNHITFIWTNPSSEVPGKGLTGVIINYSTIDFPGPTGGTKIYMGNGGSTSLGSYCRTIIHLPNADTMYYCTLVSYLSTSAGEIYGKPYNINFKTPVAEINLKYTDDIIYKVPPGYSKLSIKYDGWFTLPTGAPPIQEYDIPIKFGDELKLFFDNKNPLCSHSTKVYINSKVYLTITHNNTYVSFRIYN